MPAPDSYPHVTCGCPVRGQRAGRRRGDDNGTEARHIDRGRVRPPGELPVMPGARAGGDPGRLGLGDGRVVLTAPAGKCPFTLWSTTRLSSSRSSRSMAASVPSSRERPPTRSGSAGKMSALSAPSRPGCAPIRTRRPTPGFDGSGSVDQPWPRARATAAVQAWMVLCTRRMEPWC